MKVSLYDPILDAYREVEVDEEKMKKIKQSVQNAEKKIKGGEKDGK